MDYISDNSGRTLLRLEQIAPAPEFVKNASLDPEDIAGLSSHQFADPSRREFPVDTPGHTWLSYGFAKIAGNVSADVIQVIRKAAEFQEITADLDTIDAAVDSYVKAASAGDEVPYALSIDFGEPVKEASTRARREGGVQNFYPLRNPFEIEDAAMKFANQRLRLPLPVFVEGCQNIVKQAQAHQMDVQALIPRVVRRYGIPCIPDFDYLRKEAAKRVEQTGDTVYNDIVECAEQNSHELDMTKFAELWYKADCLNGVKTDDYEKAARVDRQPDPYLMFSTGMPVSEYEKEASKFVAVSDDAMIPVTTVAKIDQASVLRHRSAEKAAGILGVVKQAAAGDGIALTTSVAALAPADRSLIAKLALAV